MFTGLKNLLYTQVYVNIIANIKETVIYVKEINSNGSSTNFKEVLNSSKKSSIRERIQSFVKISPIHYISIIDNSPSCGAAPTCSKEKKELYYNSQDYQSICVSTEWTYYTSKTDLLTLQGQYIDIGLDYIFSPFLILSNFFKDKIADDVAMYILVNDDNLVICIFENSKLLFASNLDMENKKPDSSDELSMDSDDEELELDLDDTININLEDVNVDDSVDEFEEIEELESFDEMEEFSQDAQEGSADEGISDFSFEDQSGFGVDYKRFTLIQNAVGDFYKDDKFDSKFIEVVYIADAIGMNNELKVFLEEEMFLSVYIRKMDLGNELCELARVEPK